jgi:hypothetical protein
MNANVDSLINANVNYLNLIFDNPQDPATIPEVTPFDNAVEFTLKTADSEDGIPITLDFYLPCESDVDIYKYLVISQNARNQLLHHLGHAQGTNRETFFLHHPFFMTPLSCGNNPTDEFLCKRLRERLFYR